MFGLRHAPEDIIQSLRSQHRYSTGLLDCAYRVARLRFLQGTTKVQISNGTISGELRRDTVEKLDGLRAQVNLHLRPQAFEHSIHFLLDVVVNQANSQEAAALFHAEPFGQI